MRRKWQPTPVFLTGIWVSQEAGKVTWFSHLFMNFPQFVVIHKVKDFRVVNEAEVDALLELPCFLHNPVNVGNLISSSSASLKSMLFSRNTPGSSWFMICWSLAWRFWALPSSMWNEHSCTGVWTLFGISFQFGIGMKTGLFRSCSHCWVFQFADIMSAAL